MIYSIINIFGAKEGDHIATQPSQKQKGPERDKKDEEKDTSDFKSDST